MINFENVESHGLQTAKSVSYSMTEMTLEGHTPILHVRSATPENTAYLNATLKRTGKFSRQIETTGINAKLLNMHRDNDRKLYSKYVIVSWENIFDSDGKSVTFSKANCLEFLNALPDWIFDGLRNFCGKHFNFIDNDDMDDTDKETIAKN